MSDKAGARRRIFEGRPGRVIALSCGVALNRGADVRFAGAGRLSRPAIRLPGGSHDRVAQSALGVALALLTPRRVASAQPPQRQPTPNDTLKSTEVAPDHKVTFRIYAPKADEVSVGGDFGQGGKMTKDDKGVWSITVGPLAPDFYSYTFNVDGVRTVDPKNADDQAGASPAWTACSSCPGEEAEFEATKDVPHGEVRAAWYRSGTLDAPRRMHVYTPPGYEGGSEKYPVFYLLHGGGDEDSGWSTIGRAGFILDNLLAEKKAVPMIVVMPNGSLPRPANMPRVRRPATPPSPEVRAAMEAAQNRFTDELLKEVVPFVEKTYRVKTGPENRALAGLSMGGGQTLAGRRPRTRTSSPTWASGAPASSAATPTTGRSGTRPSSQRPTRSTARSSCARSASATRTSPWPARRPWPESLEKHGIKHELHISGGGHTWINWRHYLNELAPKLFR